MRGTTLFIELNFDIDNIFLTLMFEFIAYNLLYFFSISIRITLIKNFLSSHLINKKKTTFTQSKYWPVFIIYT